MSAPKPFARNRSSVSTIRAGLTSRVPLSRKYNVPRTDPASASVSSWARSSRPVASGTGGVPRPEDVHGGLLGGIVRREDLLRATGAVALAPAHVGVVLDHLAQLEDPVHERLGPRRTAGNVNVDRHELVGRHDRVVVEDAHRGRAGTHR